MSSLGQELVFREQKRMFHVLHLRGFERFCPSFVPVRMWLGYLRAQAAADGFLVA